MTDESRKEFEAWFLEENPQDSAEWQSGGQHYRFWRTQISWESWQASRAALQQELEQARRIQLRADKGEVWFWQGDGYDFPESLNCPVIITAMKLQRILAELSQARAELAKCGKENCMGQEVEGCARWVREEKLLAAEAANQRLREALRNTTQTLRLLLVPMDPSDADARAEVRNEIRLAEAALESSPSQEVKK